MAHLEYDEFSFFHENVAEWNLTVPVPPVRRETFLIDGERRLSALRWGGSPPELVLVHGGAQNAHTFDTVALAAQRPLLAVDLPGHGHSDPGPYGLTAIASHASDLGRALAQVLDKPRPLVGMSLGGLTSIVLADQRPDLISDLVLVDITPGVTPAKAKHITDFVNGPKTFDSFEELLERTIAFNPTRSVSSLRRGILHNARQLADGTWVWRHQQHEPAALTAPPVEDLWEVLSRRTGALTLVRGLREGSVVTDDDVEELRRRVPHVRVVEVPNAGHSVQGDDPLALAEVLRSL